MKCALASRIDASSRLNFQVNSNFISIQIALPNMNRFSVSDTICVLTEIVGFTANEETLRAIATDGSDPWRFRF
jgi:hypothetical protein